jgi:hypothetical protein
MPEGHRVLADARFGDDPSWPSLFLLEDTHCVHVAASSKGGPAERVFFYFIATTAQNPIVYIRTRCRPEELCARIKPP